MKKRKLLLAVCGLLTVGMLATGCGNSTQKEKPKTENTDKNTTKKEANKEEDKKENKDKKEEANKEVSLSKWNGTWNDMSLYLDAKELEPAFERLAKKDKVSVDEAKAKYKEKRKCDFGGLKVEGNTVTFLDNFASKDGKEISKSDYTFVTTHKSMLEKHELTWYEFKANDANAKYPVLMLMDLHTDEALKHFHFRYGKDAKSIMEVENWFPAVVAPDSTYEQLEEEISE